ncbi:hypothetical protein SHM_28610 (plasmid) [Spiroplasma ixodetis]|uniref:Uncharacterized protein n=1 Tax=Spiroplasma ixodetis TaxID=2141 RepID=A0ABN6T7R9_9MOLU|nr:hypothetical protein SHM_28610 [Spiroplasma ixodetis]
MFRGAIMKCNYCYRRPTVVIKTKFKLVKFDMYLCNEHSKKEIVFLNNEWKRKEGDNNAVIK